jgi:hypothetical protein
MVLLFLGVILVDKSKFGWLLILPFIGFVAAVISGVGDYRVLFEVEKETIVIYRIRHRREVYR